MEYHFIYLKLRKLKIRILIDLIFLKIALRTVEYQVKANEKETNKLIFDYYLFKIY